MTTLTKMTHDIQSMQYRRLILLIGTIRIKINGLRLTNQITINITNRNIDMPRIHIHARKTSTTRGKRHTGIMSTSRTIEIRTDRIALQRSLRRTDGTTSNNGRIILAGGK